VRDLQGDRKTRGSKSGDVLCHHLGIGGGTNKETRKVRSGGEFVLALDDLIAELRAEGFRIGVVVDEAHHGFTRAAEAVRFYRETMRPDFTLMITATPDDQDVDKFKKAAGIGHLHRIRVSRKEAVDAGLIKDGIKSIAYLAADDQKELVDFRCDRAGGWLGHARGHQAGFAGSRHWPGAADAGAGGNSNAAVEEARTRLAALGVPDSKIAWYTADDPNDDLLAVAIDEQKEVLIFKVAVALGFDAPRAFTLVSMRGAKDTDFGIQVVGRILRVHGRLQGPTLEKKLPELLRSRLCVSGRCGESERLGACRREDQRDPERAIPGVPVHDGGEGGRAQRNSGDAQRADAIAVGALHAARLGRAGNGAAATLGRRWPHRRPGSRPGF
jgi:type III restriction enzyme